MNFLCIVHSIVIDDDGDILLGLRRDSGEWSLPCGKVEDGESIPEAGLRELFEETGIQAISFKPQVVFTSYSTEPCVHVVGTAFNFLSKFPVSNSEEFSSILYFSKHDLPEPQFAPTYLALEKINGF